MFNKLRRARSDFTTMNALFACAERIAHEDGLDRPGAEHLLLAALDLDDGIAKEALSTFEVDPGGLRAAIVGQYEESLRTIGLIVDDNAITSALPSGGQPRGPYRSQGSLQTAFRRAAAFARRDKAALNSGYVLLAVTNSEQGVVPRSLDNTGIDRTLLVDRTRRLLAL